MNDTPKGSGATAPSEEMLRLVAAGLADVGLSPRLGGDPDDQYLVIPWRHAQCLLTVTDWGQVEWEYRPWNSAVPDPRWLAGHAAVLLVGLAKALRGPGVEPIRDGLSSRALVGLGLKARGFNVALDVITDTECLEVYTEIVATVPGSPEAAEVRITDDGTVTWTRNCRADSAADWTAFAEEITTTLVQAMTAGG